MTMEMTLTRAPSANGFTLGRLAIDGQFVCWTCEDVARPGGPKIPGETAIPEGRYRVIVDRSERFSRAAGHDVFLPLLLDVPGYSGVRIHSGNTAADTEGCILPGQRPTATGVAESRAAFTSLFARIQAAIGAGEQVWLTVASETAVCTAQRPAG